MELYAVNLKSKGSLERIEEISLHRVPLNLRKKSALGIYSLIHVIDLGFPFSLLI